MNFQQALTDVKIGQQLRLTRAYQVGPTMIAEGSTGTVIANELDEVDPRIRIRLDGHFAELDDNVLHVRGPEESLHIEDGRTVGVWSDEVPFEIIAPPTSSAHARKAALAAELAARRAERALLEPSTKARAEQIKRLDAVCNALAAACDAA